MFAANEEEVAWTKVQNAISNIPEGFSPYLHHLGKYFMVLRRKEDKVLPQLKVSKFSGFSGTSQFSSFLHLHPSMFHDHMPWAYNNMFKGQWNLFTWQKGIVWFEVS